MKLERIFEKPPRDKVMSNVKRRLEKIEAKTQAMDQEASDREALILEIQRLEDNGDGGSVEAFKLRAELCYGPNWTLAEVIAKLASKDQT